MNRQGLEDKQLLREIAQQLEKWVKQSETGGWSTHQVKLQQELATNIYAHLGRSS